MRKRNRCKRELIEWSRRKFKRVDKELERKKIELQHIQKYDMSERDKRREVNIEEITGMATWEDPGRYLGLLAILSENGLPLRERGEGCQGGEKSQQSLNKSEFEGGLGNTRETGMDQSIILCKLGCVCWCIWKERNQHIFQQSNMKPQKVIVNSECLTTESYNATEGGSNDNRLGVGKSGVRKRVTWRPPPKEWLKVNTDAAFQKETRTAAATVIVSALVAKAQAYREALQLMKCIIESDCLPLVQAIKAKVPVAEVDAVIRYILQLLDDTSDMGATWTPKDGNNLAHQLVAMAVENGLQRQGTVNPPVQILKTIRAEAGFASIKQSHNILNHINMGLISTNQQRHQREEDLSGRGKAETGDKDETRVET
ncbi:hypothetical protein Ahy_B06g083735 isoform A [Arachis hypogaea]|uniref:RNase H type-1 domain-containing protein n=1 Tax=Arachis hypogaea TaxID=3818 RepID=A0A444YQB5_ARAHY|nr:hypothetical protein Ahy_B06g083735 isoform A [Arachis hypogaea]